MFKEKVPNRCYKNVVVEKATTLAEELYMPIYQVDSLPEQYIPESFARALVSEASHSMPMNWTRYAEGAWGRKKGDEAEQRRRQRAPTIKFKPSGSQVSYESRIMNRLQTESRKDFGEYRATRTELQEVQDRVIELQER
jgi:hypothetical protein